MTVHSVLLRILISLNEIGINLAFSNCTFCNVGALYLSFVG